MHGVGSPRDPKAKDERTEHRGFKAYDNQYLHIDVKYLAKTAIETLLGYLFVAIHTSTRWIFISISGNKTATNAPRFFREPSRTYPTGIWSILIDTNKPFISRFSACVSAHITSLTRFAQRSALNINWLYQLIGSSNGSKVDLRETFA